VGSFTNIANLVGEFFQAMPSHQLRERLLSRVSHSPRVPGILLEQSGLLIARSDELGWQTMAPGISYKPLYQDAARKCNTALVRMDAGAHYPSHHHAASEQLFMLSGDLHVESQIIGASNLHNGKDQARKSDARNPICPPARISHVDVNGPESTVR